MDTDDPTIVRNFVNTYLDSPIIEGEARKGCANLIRCQLGHTSRELRNVKQLYDAIPRNSEIEFQVYDPSDLSWLLSTLSKAGARTYMRDAHRIAMEIYGHVVESLARKCGAEIENQKVLDPSQTSEIYLNKAELFMRFTDAIACSRAQGGRRPVKTEYEGHTLVGTQYFCVWIVPDDDIGTVIPYEAILMFKDLCLGRANVFDTLRVVYPGDAVLRVAVKQALKWCESCLITYGNKGYEVLKNLESISKAYVIEMTDKVFKEDGALQRLLAIVRKKEKSFDPGRTTFLIDELVNILCRCTDVAHVVEVFGLMKLTGHPLVDPRIGGESAAYEASIPRNTTYHDARQLRNNWCRMYTEGFIRKTHRWPPLIFEKGARHTRLYQLFSQRERNITRDSYDITDWEGVTFKDHAEFEYFTNFLDLMDDKSISHYLTEFRATWRKEVKPRSHRRLLLEMLSRPDVSIRAIVELVEAGDIPEDWLIVSLYPKEREFKLSARMFSMMVFEMRAFFTCLEANLADKVFPYLPQQTMTLKKTEIQSIFFKLTKPASSESIKRLFIEVDLSRWNLRWRDMPIRMIGNDLNDIFGLKRSFTVVHEFFSRCMILVRVSGYEPETLDENPPRASNLLWYNHEGGFEGIAQKHWTLATYSMIDLGVSQFGFNYRIVGQADNQVILAYVDVSDITDPDTYLKHLSRDVAKSIADACARVGQDAKPEECLESTCVVTYSKDFFILGAEYFMSLKAFSRIFPRGTSEFPTIINCVGSIGAGCVAAAEKLKDPMLGYYLMLYHGARYLMSLQTRTSLESLTLTAAYRGLLVPTLVRTLLTLPNSLGGLPLPTFVSFLYKGGSDPLSKDLSSVEFLPQQERFMVERCLHAILAGAWTRPDHSPDSVLTDPYSIPISSLPLAESKVQAISLEHVRNASANIDIREIVDADVDVYEQELVNLLMGVQPFNPAFLADILDHSVAGVKRMVSKMFTSTRTIQSLTQGDESDPGGMILRSSASTFSSICHRIGSVSRTRAKVTDVLSMANRLRKLWTTLAGTPVRSVEGITNYVPLAWDVRTQSRKAPADEIQVTFIGGEKAGSLRGPYEPYLGADTHEKRTKYGYKIVTSSSAERSAAQLYKIMTQPGVDKTLESLVASVASTRTNTDLRALKTISSRAIGGKIAHRYTSAFDLKSASLVGCASFAGYVVFQSDYSGLLSGSLVDYPVMFQEFFTAGTGLLNFLFHRGVRHAVTLGFVVPAAMVPLPDEDTRAPEVVLTAIPRLVDNKLVFCPDLRLMRQERPYSNELFGEEQGALSLESPVTIARSAATRELRRSNIGNSLADHSTGGVRLSLDILEYRGLGMNNIIQGISEAIADHTYQSLFVRTETAWRWTAMPLMATLGASFAHSIVRVSSHPLFAEDIFVQSIIQPSDMVYSYYRATARVGRVIAAAAHKAYVTRPSSEPASVRLLYQDDEESASVEAALTAFRKGLVVGVMASEISAHQAHDIDKRTLLQRLRGATDSPARLSALYSAVLVMAEYSASHALTSMEKWYSALAEGSVLKISASTLTESLRLRRRYNLTVRATARIDHMETTSERPLVLERSVIAGSEPTVHLVLREVDTTTEAWKRFRFLRAQTRVYGWDAPVVHSFWPARHSLRSKALVIIGSGNGGCAAVASKLGVERIILHDLQTDVRPESWLIPRVSIPALERIKTRSFIERSTAGYGQFRGDITSESTWDDLASLCPVEACVVYDLPITSTRQLVWLVSHIALYFPGSPLVTRWIRPLFEMENVLSCLQGSFEDVEVYPVFYASDGVEVIVRMVVLPGQSIQPYMRSHSIAESLKDVMTSAGVEQFGGGADANWRAEFADLDVEIADEELLLNRQRRALLEDASTKTVHGFTYSEWTRVLWYRIACQLRCKSGEERLMHYLDVCYGPPQQVRIGAKIVHVARSKAYQDFMQRTVPRCL